jgi:hypothetical protein
MDIKKPFYFFFLASNLYRQYILHGSDMNYDQSNYNTGYKESKNGIGIKDVGCRSY